jgi:hypothetical protein
MDASQLAARFFTMEKPILNLTDVSLASYTHGETIDAQDGRAIALNCLPKYEVSAIRVIPPCLEAFILNPEFGALVLP